MNFSLDAIQDEVLKDLLSKLLKEEPMERIGAKDMNELLQHSFFKDVDWDNLPKQKPPPFNEKSSQNKCEK